MDLSHIKSELYRSLLKQWSNPSDVESEYQTFTMKIACFDLFGFLKSLSDESISYFRDKDGKIEKLFIGIQSSFSHFDEIEKMQNLANQNEKLTFIGGFNFDMEQNGVLEWADLKPALFTLPYLELHKSESGTFLFAHYPKTIFQDKEAQTLWAHNLDEVFKLRQKIHYDSYSIVKSLKLNPNRESWDKIFQKSIQKITDESFHKVVLARKKVFELDTSTGMHLILDSLENLNPNSYFIKFSMKNKSSFITNTPERLFIIEGETIVTEAIAGTRPVGETAEENEDFISELKGSYKEISEHRFVRKYLEDNLSPIASGYKWEVEEDVIQLKYIQHLYSKLRVKCRTAPKCIDIIKRLHPTPAVGGTPWKKAKTFLIKNETLNRGLYASPVGIFSKNVSDFCVAIRSALFSEDKVHIYAGAGIVKGSDVDGEWNEIENKMKNFEHIIVGEQ